MTDPEQVVEANLKFYFALESQDIDLMDEVWATDASAICVHPGWTRLAGWENIRASWEQMFRNTNTHMRIDVSEVTLYYRPLYAVEYFWKAKDKRQVLEFDAVTGEVRAEATQIKNAARAPV